MNKYQRQGKKPLLKYLLYISIILLAFLLGLYFVTLITDNNELDYANKSESTTLSNTPNLQETIQSTSDITIESTINQTSEQTSEVTVESETEQISEPISDIIIEPTTGSTSEELLLNVDAPKLQEIINSMSLYEKICQMFIVIPDTITEVNATTIADSKVESALNKYPVGGLILMSSNIKSDAQVQEFISKVQSLSKIPLFISCDEEGGRVARLKSILGAHSIKSMFSYKDDDESTAFDNAVTLAQVLKRYGFNMDFAPVADVWSNSANSVIGDRAYSDDFKQASQLVKSALLGFMSENIIPVIKHFPGHGNTSEDSHYGLAYVYKTREQLLAEELLPFKSCIDSGAEVVMLGHLIVKELDFVPATISKSIVTDLLRNELEFKGLVITDALNMQAMTKHFGNDVVVKAIDAGVDLLLVPPNMENAVNAIQNAITNGTLTEERIDESVARIIALKIKYKIIIP